MNMSKQNTIFENGENTAKFSTDPTAEIPGPTLLIVVSTELNVVEKSKLLREIKPIETANIAM